MRRLITLGIVISLLFLLLGCDPSDPIREDMYIGAGHTLYIDGVPVLTGAGGAEVDPIVRSKNGIIVANGVAISAITDNHVNWDTAFGWGNHAAVGYVVNPMTTDLNANDKNISNIKQINMTDPTLLTINAGAITKTQTFHTVDTEGAAATDFLDTINGGAVGDELILTGTNTGRVILISRTGNIRLRTDAVIETFSFASPAGASGTFYIGGYYDAPATDANLTQAAPTVTYGTANAGYGAHAFLVAAAAGVRDAGTVSIVVSGTSVDSSGNRTAADSETIVSDITTMVANKYYETDKRWSGTITYTLTLAGGATTASADFNYGFAMYDSLEGSHFTITHFEVKGRAGATDNGFDLQLIHHEGLGWTYSAAAFVPGDGIVCGYHNDYHPEDNIINGASFYYDRDVAEVVNGDNNEGYLVRIITTANKAVDTMDAHIYSVGVPAYRYLVGVDKGIRFIYNGFYWMEI